MSAPVARWRDIIPSYVSVQDRELRVIEANDAFQRDFGSRVGEHCYRVYKQRRAPCRGCPVLRTFSDGKTHSSEEVVITRDGQQASVVVQAAPLLGMSGEIIAVMEVSTNVTEVKRQHGLAMMGLAVAGIAHRAKNILMGLEGGVMMINAGFETKDGATVDEGWQMVERNVERIGRIIKALLYCAKERAPQLARGISPARIVREVHELYRARTADEGIELRLEVDDEEHDGAYDAQGLHNLTVNLMTNAIDACRFDETAGAKQHVITLRCLRGEAGGTVIEVADNGGGIPEQIKDQVFRGFFSTKGTEGTGLGLLVVQRVVEEHGGVITFESEEGEGSVFRVELPRASEEPAVAGEPIRERTRGE